LSKNEIRALIPWLLENATQISDSRFWGKVGSLFELADLEQVSERSRRPGTITAWSSALVECITGEALEVAS
jgi:hypothetical protein